MRISDWSSDVCSSDLKQDYAHIREVRANKGQSALIPIADARANGFAIDEHIRPFPPEQPGVHAFDNWDMAELADWFDWTPFFRAWELAGLYPAILDEKHFRERARHLYPDPPELRD